MILSKIGMLFAYNAGDRLTRLGESSQCRANTDLDVRWSAWEGEKK